MAYRISNSNTTLSSATGWDTVTNTPTLHASTTITVSGSIYSATFTAPNTTNKCTGVAVLLITKGAWSSGDLTVTATLQENSVDTAATVTITINTTATSFSENTWVYFRFPTPYTFTSTTAGYYRFKMTRGTATTSPTLRADSGASNFAYMATDNRVGALASTDDLLVLGVNYSDTTVTWDGTHSIGSGLAAGSTLIPLNSITLSTALYVGSHGIVQADTTASVTTTCKGHVVVSWGGSFLIGSASTAYPSNLVFSWIFSPTSTGDYAFTSYYGTCEFYGAAKSSTTLWKTLYSSGVGTAADPLVVSDSVDWSVGDEIYIFATSDNSTNFNEGEFRFIITKNSATSYVLSATSGGAEAAFAYTHNTNAYVLNVQRNIIFTTDNITKAMVAHFNTTSIGAPNSGSSIQKWTRYETLGVSSSNVQTAGITQVAGVTGTFTNDYCVYYRPLYCGYWGANNQTIATINGLIICKSASGNYMLYGQAMANKTFNDLFIVDGNASGGTFYGGSCVFNRLIMNAVRKTTGNTTTGAYTFSLANNMVFNDCESSACGTDIGFSGNNADVVMNRCSFGTKGKSTFNITTTTTYQGSILFNECYFGGTTFWNTTSLYNYKDCFSGSTLKFHKYSNTENKHLWYTPYGIALACGSGLDDTLVRTPGSLNVRIAPESLSPGFSWSFSIPANVNQVVPFSGYFLKNVAMGTDVCTVSLFLPGNPITGTPDDTVTLSDNVSNAWTGSAVQAVSLAAYYTGTVDGFATVVINAKSTTAGAYLYCADFYNSGDTTTLYDKLAGLTIWEEGMPSPIITQLSLGGIAPAVWGVATAGLTAAGTTGNKLNHIDDVLSNEIE